MSFKRILGTMLASRMGGRGHRHGSRNAGAMMGLRRPRHGSRLGGKLGIAALGTMAYQAYQEHQKTSGAENRSGGASSGGIGAMIRDVADRVTGSGAADAPAAEETQAADAFSDEKAHLLIRAMVTAAYSDGALSEDERARIMGEIDEAGADAAERRRMEQEIADPKPLDELLAEVQDEETAEEFYLASRLAVDGEQASNRAYLAELRRRLGLTDEDAAEIDEMAA